MTEADVLAALAFAADYPANNITVAAEQMQILADECCPRAAVDALREAGIDIRYAAETDARSPDIDLLRRANDEERIIVTSSQFDFTNRLTIVEKRRVRQRVLPG